MEKRSIVIVFAFLVFLPQKITKAFVTNKPVTQTLLDYALVKNSVLSYEISKKIENLEIKIESIKTKIKTDE